MSTIEIPPTSELLDRARDQPSRKTFGMFPPCGFDAFEAIFFDAAEGPLEGLLDKRFEPLAIATL